MENIDEELSHLDTQLSVLKQERDQISDNVRTSTPKSSFEVRQRYDTYNRVEGQRRYLPSPSPGQELSDGVHTGATNSTDRQGVRVKPASYDGSGSWTDFKSHFDSYARINKWNMEDNEMLSKRAQQTPTSDFLAINRCKVSANSYDGTINPQGCVNLGTAENKLCEDLWLKKISEVSGSAVTVSKDILYYYQYHGLKRVRETFCKFIEEHFKSKMKIEEEKLILLDGVAATLNALAFTLADDGDVFLCPTPAYTRIKYDMLYIGGVDIYEVPMFDEESSEDPCKMRTDLLESYLQRAKQEGFTVRGVIVTNPNNPTGKVYTPHELTEVLDFCKREELHVIFDEIYALSTQGQGCFTSVLSMTVPDPDRTHFIWGFSKDFGLSGFRCGVVFSHNTRVINHLQKVAIFCAIPAPTQTLINGILSDTDWIDKTYFPTYYHRAKETHKLVKDVLDELNIPTAYNCRNVIFFWMDLSQFLKERTRKEEIKLFNMFMDAGLYICPGTELFCHVPGWFRLSYTLPKQDVKEGLRRFRAVLTQISKGDNYECPIQI